MIIRRCSSSNSDALSQEKEDHPDLNLGMLAAMTTIYTIAEGAVTYPYDLVKTRQQMTQQGCVAAGSAPARTHLSTGAHLMRIRQEGGVRALYRGFGWNLVGAIPSEVVYYIGYTQVKQALLLTPTGQANPSAVFVLSATVADLLSVVLSVPADVVSQRLQLQSSREALASIGGLQIARGIVRREGAGGLWRGAGVSLACYLPHSAVWWLTHEKAKVHLERRLRCGPEHAGMLGLSGALAGIAATTVTNPVDVIKTRAQCFETPQSLHGVLRGVLCEAGWRGLYSGFLPRLLAAVPRSVCTVLAYERAIAFCKRDQT